MADLIGFAVVSCANASSGVKRICIGRITDLGTETVIGDLVTLDGSGDVTAITKETGKLFAEYIFKNDGASLQMSPTSENDASSSTNTITMNLGRLTVGTRDSMNELLQEVGCGLVIGVELNNDDKFIVGYDNVHGTRRPLTITGGDVNSGAALKDESKSELVFSNETTNMPLPCAAAFDFDTDLLA